MRQFGRLFAAALLAAMSRTTLFSHDANYGRSMQLATFPRRYRPGKVRRQGSKLARKAAAGTLTKIHY